MFQVKCIEKIRDKINRIIGYKLVGKNKKTISVKPEKLKEAIKSEQIEVTNLTLTSDNRLIDKKPVTSSKPKNIDTESLLNRVKSLGYIIKTFDTDCGHKCYVASSIDSLKHMLIIPDDVKYICDLFARQEDIHGNELNNYMSNIEGALKVIGGKNLVSTRNMFQNCAAQSIDLSSFDTSNVRDMRYMFEGCEAHSINLGSFDTSKVTYMGWMFQGCEAQSLDLGSFDTSNVVDMNCMFEYCEAHSINLSSFGTSRVRDMNHMFASCVVQYLDLRSFNTSNVIDMSSMFSMCEAQSIDLSSFSTSKVIDTSCMFSNCKAQIKVTEHKLKSQLQKDRR